MTHNYFDLVQRYMPDHTTTRKGETDTIIHVEDCVSRKVISVDFGRKIIFGSCDRDDILTMLQVLTRAS